MTAIRDRPGDTARYQPPVEGRFPDVFQISRPPAIAPVQGTLGAARFAVNAVPGHEGLFHFWLQIYDLRGPLVQRDRFDVNHAGWAASTGIDTRYKQVACLPFLNTTYASPAAASGIAMTIISAWVPAFNKLAVAFNDQFGLTTSYLYTETSASNPALTQLTYNHGPINSMTPLSVNGVDYLGIAMGTGNVRLLSDLAAAPTEAGTLGVASSTTNVNGGMMQMALPHSPILFHIGNAFWEGNADVTMGTFTPTIASTGVPVGGYALGLASFAGSPVRAYFVVGDGNPSFTLPGNANGGSSIDVNAFRGRLASVNEFGFDYQETFVPLKSVQIASLIRDGVVLSDTDRIIFYNGRVQRDLRIFADPAPNSDRQLKVCGFYVQDHTELFAEVNEIASPNGTFTTRRSVWRYDFDIDDWGQCSTWQTISGTTGIQSFFGNGSTTGTLPMSRLTGFLHGHVTQATSGNTWFRQFQGTPGVNPLTYRKTAGATATAGQATEASATITLPNFDIPGLEGWPKIITRVQGPPTAQIGWGGTGAYMTIDTGDGSSVTTFKATEPSGRYPVDDEAYNRSEVETIQLTLSLFRATTGTDPTLMNMNLLPLTIEGFCYKEALTIPARWTSGQRSR